MLMAKVKFPGSKGYNNYMEMYTSAHKEDISLAKEFQKQVSNTAQNNLLLIKVIIKCDSKLKWN